MAGAAIPRNPIEPTALTTDAAMAAANNIPNSLTLVSETPRLLALSSSKAKRENGFEKSNARMRNKINRGAR
jgi:hypothetical protein